MTILYYTHVCMHTHNIENSILEPKVKYTSLFLELRNGILKVKRRYNLSFGQRTAGFISYLITLSLSFLHFKADNSNTCMKR